MKIRKFLTVSLLVLSSFAANNVAPTKTELESMYEKAFKAFEGANYDQALTELDAIDARQPDLSESQNLRGVIFMRQGAFDKAEAALTRAIELDPKFWNARFNLAEVPFLQKNWTEARNRFQALLAANASEIQSEAAQLIEYKILLTYVLENKPNLAESILARFELNPQTPAAQYGRAAMALQRNDANAAREILSGAEKKFSSQLNKLFAESLYAVGWLEKPTGATRASLEISSPADRAARSKADARAKFEQAQQALQRGDAAGAFSLLEQVDPEEAKAADFQNLRGETLLAQGRFDEAETHFNRAVKADAKMREAQYNLAEIPFKKKEYATARERLEALFASTPGGDKNQASQLIKYKIFLTLLLEGKEKQAQKMMDQFQFTGDTPALYYAQAAWEYKQNNATKAEDWVTSANKIYSPALNAIFAESFYDLGWLQRSGEQAAPIASQLAQAEPIAPAEGAPGIEPSPIPGASVAESRGLELATAEAMPIPGMQATTSLAETASAVEVLTAPSPAEMAAEPSASISITARPAAEETAVAAVASTPATALAPAEVEDFAAPGFAEKARAFLSSRNVLVGGLVTAGVVILGWVLVPEIRRRTAVSASRRAVRESEETGEEAGTLEQVVPHARVAGGPPQLSLRLKATEPSVRRSAIALGKGSRTNGNGHTNGNGNGHQPVSFPPPAPADLADVEEGVSEVRPLEEAPTYPEAAEIPATLEPALVAAPAEEAWTAAEETSAPVEAIGSVDAPAEPVEFDPIGQGQPVPQLLPVAAEASISETITSKLETSTPPVPEAGASAESGGTAGLGALRGAAVAGTQQPVITHEPSAQQQTKPDIMPEPTQTPPAIRTATKDAPAGAGGAQPAGSPQTAVQLTLSCEIASLQLTPSFKMGALQVRPTSKVVTMRLAPSQQPQPAMNLQVTFEIASIQPAGGTLGTLRLTPSQQQKPGFSGSSALTVSGVQLVSNFETAPVQLMASQQGRAPVNVTAGFNIATVEFSPSFEISAIVLNSNSRTVNVQLPGGGGQPEGAPVFEIGAAQVGSNGELSNLQLSPSAKRA